MAQFVNLLAAGEDTGGDTLLELVVLHLGDSDSAVTSPHSSSMAYLVPPQNN